MEADIPACGSGEHSERCWQVPSIEITEIAVLKMAIQTTLSITDQEKATQKRIEILEEKNKKIAN